MQMLPYETSQNYSLVKSYFSPNEQNLQRYIKKKKGFK